MAIDFDAADIPSWNALNPCCCALPECLPATAEHSTRSSSCCVSGYPPYALARAPNYPGTDPEPFPGAFDPFTLGTLIPVYQNKTETDHTVITGVFHCEVEKYIPKPNNPGQYVLEQKWMYDNGVSYDNTDTRERSYGKERHEWPAGDRPAGTCPPESGFSHVAPPASVSISAAPAATGSSKRLVTLSWIDSRGTLPPPEGVTPPPPAQKVGLYELRLDNFQYFSSGDSFQILMDKTDTTCHVVQIRHRLSAPNAGDGACGQWSLQQPFALGTNPCCVADEKPCTDETEGNWQHSLGLVAVNNQGRTWKTSYTENAVTLPTQGTYYNCAGTATANAQTRWDVLGGVGSGQPYMPLGAFVITYTPEKKLTKRTGAVNKPNTLPAADQSDSYAQVVDKSESGTTESTQTIELTVDQNLLGQINADAQFTRVSGIMTAWGPTYKWGTTATGGALFAKATSRFPETDGSGTLDTLIAAYMTQRRFRWYVPPAYKGSSHTTKWDIARFPGKWVDWRAEYYQWAVKKYEFLNKPKPGDDDYPVAPNLADFPPDDPETTDYDEHADAYAAAQTGYTEEVAAIDAIADPGAAPAQPAERPEILGAESGEWEWSSGQPEGPQEIIDACDPTKKDRELTEPVEPVRADYGTQQAFDAAHAAWVSLHAAWVVNVAAREAATARQSPWYLLSPDRASSWREKPAAVPPLRPNATSYEVSEHQRKVATYNFKLGRYNSGRRETFCVCNVRHLCGMTPAGPFESYDLTFPTTEVPPLSPATADPYTRYAWYHASTS